MRDAILLSTVLTVLFALAQSAPAGEGAGPAAVYVEGLAEHTGQYAFYVFRPPVEGGNDPAQPFWARVDVKQPAEPGEAGVRINAPPKTGVLGEMRLVAVRPDMAEKTPMGDAAWFRGRTPGVVPVAGAIEVVPLRQSRGAPILRYRMEKTADGFALTLLNPERLDRERPEDPEPAIRPTSAGTPGLSKLLWFGLAAVAAVIIVGTIWWWRRIPRTKPNQVPPPDQ